MALDLGWSLVRPRTISEILDDAWDLTLADAPFLLLLGGLFQVPACAALLFLLAWPALPGVAGVLVAAGVAGLLPLTGLGSGACQEWLRARAEGQPASLRAALGGALRRAPQHIAARAAVLAGTLLGLVLVVLPGLAIWAGGSAVHALIASGRGGTWAGLEGVSRDAAFDPGKMVLVALVRVPLMLFAVLNVHLVLSGFLWAAGNFGGLDVAVLDVVATLNNPVYIAALVLLCWMLLSPYNEAVNFLLHADTRARREGLDLFYRVGRLRVTRPAATVVLLAGAWLLLGAPGLGGRLAAEEPAPRHYSREEIKGFLRREGPAGKAGDTPKKADTPRREEKKRAEESPDDEDVPRRGRPRTGAFGGAAAGGLGTLGWMVLAGAVVAVLVLAVVRALSARRERPARPTKTDTGQSAPEAPAELLPHEQPASAWWRKADQLARAGKFLEAVRCAYQAVLSQLHHQHLVRCEQSRTNGEYVQQVRQAPQAPEGLAETFAALTRRFEVHWYGDGTCGAEEYRATRELAEEVRAQAG